ncbi:MAG TPA: DUF192 domain-containing protein [Rubrivivax sp.]|nr:DUF192 domain-containing protein [Rubrivivax sp.]
MMRVKTFNSLTRAFTLVALLTLGGLCPLQPLRAQDGPQPRLQTIELTAGMHVIRAELAITPAQQATGMMFRTEMQGNEGMLFVNDELGTRCFWMRNTLIPLTIAFLADDGTIVNLADMQPRSESSHCSAQPVRYALEMRQGWFAKRGLKAGARLRGKPFTP